jgi:hypothetical protein
MIILISALSSNEVIEKIEKAVTPLESGGPEAIEKTGFPLPRK